MDPRKPLSLLAAQRFFALALLLTATGTFLALGGIASAQALCHDNSMGEYWTPAYAVFVQQTEALKKWTCTWWQIGFWWVLGCQLSFVLFISLAWYNGFLIRHAMPFFAHGATASALSVVACLSLMDNGSYYVGYVRTLGAIAFAGFALVGLANGILGIALAELMFSKTCAAAARSPGDLEAPAPHGPREDAVSSSSFEAPPCSEGPLDKNDSGTLA